MPWQNLAEDLAEEFGKVCLDSASLYKDGLRWTRPVQDSEERKNYDHWYWHQVWYPKNKGEKVNARARRYYHEVVKKDPEKLAKKREKNRKYCHRTQCPEGYAKKLERNKTNRLKRLMTVEGQAKNAEYNRRRRLKRAIEKGQVVDYTRGRGRPRKAVNGQTPTSSTGE